MANASSKGTAMRVAAIRVGADLRRLLELEAARVGVSVSQYVREAALARATAAAVARGEDTFDLLARAAAEVGPSSGTDAAENGTETRGRKVREKADEARSDALALQAQSEQARRRSAQLQSRRRARSGT